MGYVHFREVRTKTELLELQLKTVSEVGRFLLLARKISVSRVNHYSDKGEGEPSHDTSELANLFSSVKSMLWREGVIYTDLKRISSKEGDGVLLFKIKECEREHSNFSFEFGQLQQTVLFGYPAKDEGTILQKINHLCNWRRNCSLE